LGDQIPTLAGQLEHLTAGVLGVGLARQQPQLFEVLDLSADGRGGRMPN